MNNDKTLIEIIESGNFKKAYEMIQSKSNHDYVFELLIDSAYKHENITLYAFCYYLFVVTKDWKWLEHCITVLVVGLSPIEGAYALALQHARELLSFSRTKALNWILFIYFFPEHLVTDDEALLVAKEILSGDKENIKAKEVIDKLEKLNT